MLYLIKRFLLVTIVLAVWSFFILKSSQIHRDWIRSYVGSNVAYIANERGVTGTGFSIELNKGVYTITNAHVCSSAILMDGKSVLVKHGTSTKRFEILAMYEDIDICLIEPFKSTGLKIASSLKAGQEIAIVGHPNRWPLAITRGEYIGEALIHIPVKTPFNEQCKSGGYRANMVICVYPLNRSISDARILPGSSGSPAVNFFGQVIGVVSEQAYGWAAMVTLSDLMHVTKDY